MWKPTGNKKIKEPPIQNLNSIDIIGALHDGGVHLIIVVSSFLDASRESQELLLNKIESYLIQLNTKEFQTEFNNPAPEKTEIVVKFAVMPDPLILQLLDNSVPWVSDNRACIKYEISGA